MEKRKEPKLKNYDYEFYFLAVLLVCGIIFYLMIKAADKPPVVDTTETKGMTVAQEISLMNTPTAPPEVKQPTYIIDGIDFYPYNSGEEGLQEVMAKMNYDSLRVLVTTFYNGAVDILSDGNLYTMQEARGGYIFYLYFPKDPVEISKTDIINVEHIEGQYQRDIYSFTMNEIGENMEVPIYVTYADGTKEKITLYITKNYDS